MSWNRLRYVGPTALLALTWLMLWAETVAGDSDSLWRLPVDGLALVVGAANLPALMAVGMVFARLPEAPSWLIVATGNALAWMLWHLMVRWLEKRTAARLKTSRPSSDSQPAAHPVSVA